MRAPAGSRHPYHTLLGTTKHHWISSSTKHPCRAPGTEPQGPSTLGGSCQQATGYRWPPPVSRHQLVLDTNRHRGQWQVAVTSKLWLSPTGTTKQWEAGTTRHEASLPGTTGHWAPAGTTSSRHYWTPLDTTKLSFRHHRAHIPETKQHGAPGTIGQPSTKLTLRGSLNN